MNKLLILFRKDIKEYVSNNFKEQGKKKDIMGFVSSLVLIAFIYGVFIYVFKAFGEMYLSNVYDNVSVDTVNRLGELLTFVFGITLIVNVVNGARKIFSSISDSKDINVLICQPISSGVIFVHRFIKIYLSQVLTTLFILLPISIVLSVLSGVGGAVYYIMMLLSVILLPAMSSAIASLIALPYVLFMQFIEAKFIIRLIGYVIIIGLGFWVYGLFLNALNQILQSGQISNFFEMSTIYKINSVATKLYPARLFTNMMLGSFGWQSLLIALFGSIACLVGSFFLIRKIYNTFIQKRLEGFSSTYKRKGKIKKLNVLQALLLKEFKTVLRTPNYAFQYFATTLSLPFMVYICTQLLISMAKGLFATECNYAIAVFVVTMFGLLTNTFCATNVSRDGRMYAMLKTLPVKVEAVIGSKLIFSGVVSVISVMASSFSLLIGNLLTFGEAVFVFANGLLFSFAGIAYATKKDMVTPCFPSTENDEVTDSNSNLSTLILIGLIVSAISGVGSILISVVLGLKYSTRIAMLVSMLFESVLTIAVFVFAVIYLFKGLKKVYYERDI